MRTYIPTTLPKVPYPDTARYPRRTTTKLAPSPCAPGAFLPESSNFLSSTQVWSLGRRAAPVPLSIAPLRSGLLTRAQSGGIGTRVLVFNDYCAQLYGPGRQALPTAVSLARICISFHPLGIACWLLSSAPSGLHLLVLSLQLLSPFLPRFLPLFPSPSPFPLSLPFSLSTLFIYRVLHKIVRHPLNADSLNRIFEWDFS